MQLQVQFAPPSAQIRLIASLDFGEKFARRRRLDPRQRIPILHPNLPFDHFGRRTAAAVAVAKKQHRGVGSALVLEIVQRVDDVLYGTA